MATFLIVLSVLSGSVSFLGMFGSNSKGKSFLVWLASWAILFIGIGLSDGSEGAGQVATATSSTAQVAEPEAKALPAPAAKAADTLKLRWESAGTAGIRVSLHTNLPDRAEVKLSVTRLYDGRSDGKAETYSLDYFSEAGTIGDWREPRLVRIDDAAWARALQSELNKFSQLGMPTTGVSVRSELEISAYAYGHNSGNRFGAREYPDLIAAVQGRDLAGKAETSIARPLATGVEVHEASLIAGNSLKAGKSYRLIGDRVPLMPSLDAKRLEDLQGIRYMPAGTLISVLEVKYRSGDPWYQVVLPERRGEKGWINSIALLREGVRADAG